MNEIKVSVVIPCYNAELTIVRAINSVLDGTVQPYEILVYDDNSTDDTVSLIEENFANITAIRLFRGTENKGAGHARNVLMKNSMGNFIAFLDADDFWYHDKLETQVNMILAENCDIITCYYDIYDEEGEKIGCREPIRSINTFTMHLTNWLPTSMTIFRKNLKCAQEMPKIRRRQDYGFWLSIFKNNPNLKCCVIDKPMGGYFRRTDSLSSSKIKNLKFNFLLFREVVGYSLFFSFVLVFLNAFIRVVRK